MALTYNPTSFLAPGLPHFLEERVGIDIASTADMLCCMHMHALQFNESPVQIGLMYLGSSVSYFIAALAVGLLTDKVVSYAKA